MTDEKENATAGTVAERIANLRGLYSPSKATVSKAARKGWTANPRVSADWRNRLPDPAAYYGARLQKLTRANGDGWAQACCPFHDDKAASLSVNVSHPNGGWTCFAGCGGGDLLSFHMRLTGKDFKAARADLLRGGA